MTPGSRTRADEIPVGQSAIVAMNVRIRRQLKGSTQAKLVEPAPVSARRRNEGGKARRDRGAST
jgi:hypothetical protein